MGINKCQHIPDIWEMQMGRNGGSIYFITKWMTYHMGLFAQQVDRIELLRRYPGGASLIVTATTVSFRHINLMFDIEICQ